MFRFFLTTVSVAPFLVLCCFASAQTTIDNSIHDVDVCELLKDPDSFDSRIVRFRGQLNFAFEGHHVHDDPCGLPILHRGIWWDYGGESLAALAQDEQRIRAMTSPIQRDAQFELFEARTHDRRKLRPDGDPCDSSRECAHYEVVATFTGRFLARRGGYGHMGCCHLFVIEQISNVEPTRTLVPDDEAKFACNHEEWQSEYVFQTPGLDARLTANKRFLTDQMRAHGDDSLIEAMDKQLSPFAGMTGVLKWSSPDLMKTYKVRFPERSSRKKGKKQPTSGPLPPVAVEVSREQCTLIGQ